MQCDANETSIRAALLEFLQKGEEPSCVFLSELFVDRFSRRADLVVANGHLAAFEIKSAADRLSRLEGQLASYEKNFEATTVVCAQKHLDSVLELARSGTGVIMISGDGVCTEVQKARYRRITKDAWLGFLPVVELRKLLRYQEIRAPKDVDRQSLLELCLRLEAPVIRAHALAYIKLRDDRNARLRAVAAEKRALRTTSYQKQRDGIPDWLAAFANTGPLVAIPRKVT